MKIMKKVSLLVGSIALATGMTVCQAADLNVAVVNVQQVLQQSPRVAAMSKKLEGQFKDRQTKNKKLCKIKLTLLTKNHPP